MTSRTRTPEEEEALRLKALHDAEHDKPAPNCPWCDTWGWQD